MTPDKYGNEIPGGDLLEEGWRRYVPASIKAPVLKYAKAIVAATGSALAFVNLAFPAYSDEAQAVVGIVLALATIVGVRQVANVE